PSHLGGDGPAIDPPAQRARCPRHGDRVLGVHGAARGVPAGVGVLAGAADPGAEAVGAGLGRGDRWAGHGGAAGAGASGGPGGAAGVRRRGGGAAREPLRSGEPPAGPARASGPWRSDRVRAGRRGGGEVTVVGAGGDEPLLLRPGGVPVESVEKVLERRISRVPGRKIRAPGLLPSHYAPRAGVLLAEPGGAVAKALTLAGNGR